MQLKPPPPKKMFNLHECDDTVSKRKPSGALKAEVATQTTKKNCLIEEENKSKEEDE